MLRIPRPLLLSYWVDPALELDCWIFQTVCLFSGLVTLALVVPLNAVQALPPLVNTIAFGYGGIALAFYAFARRGRYLSKTLYITVLASLAAIWYPNAGSAGSVIFYFFPALLFPVLYFHGTTRRVALLFTLALGGSLIVVDYFQPELATPFRGPRDRMTDLLTGYLFSSSLILAILWTMVSGYRRDRQKLTQTAHDLEASRKLLTTVIDSTTDIVWVFGPDPHPLKLYNAAFAEQFRQAMGVEPQLDTPLDGVAPPNRAREWKRLLAQALEEGSITTEFSAPDGSVSYLLTISPVRLDGQVMGLSVFGKDIMALKRAEAARDRMAERMMESQKMESLGSLAGGVAHDFNNMLASIMGYSDLLLSEEHDPERRAWLQSVLQAATRSADLTKKLLAFARRGKNIVGAVDMNLQVRDCLAVLRPSARADVTVVTEMEATWTVDADPSQMNQLLMNLCINANEAMPSGGTLKVRTSNLDLDAKAASAVGLRPGPYVQVSVTDSGVGMGDDVRPRIFEPFFTTKQRSAAGQTGTGLGLSTVYGIVQLHAGAIDVDTKPGRGTTFTVFLPKGSLTLERQPVASIASTGTGLVLVVDDEPMVRNFAIAAVTRLGYRAIPACDGDEAVRLFLAHHRELKAVILDMKMPRKDGTAAFREMLAIDATVPVIICSGYGDNEEAQNLITLGARALVSKPFRIADISKHLQAIGGATTAAQS
jgi:signal transduction histidine kinase/ActR/RegA family two-component response regulator